MPTQVMDFTFSGLASRGSVTHPSVINTGEERQVDTTADNEDGRNHVQDASRNDLLPSNQRADELGIRTPPPLQ